MMINEWAAISAVCSSAVIFATLRDANRMNGKTPQRVRVAVAGMIAAAGLYLWMAISGWWFSWPDAVFSGAVASYLLLQRRRAA